MMGDSELHQTQLLLLRSRDSVDSDRYHDAATTAGMVPHSIPVLECVLDRYAPAVRTALAEPERYSALVFTSHQAVSAAAAACDPDAVARWRASPIFAVGSRTASDVQATFGIDPVGKAAGSARALGDTIVEYFARLQDCDAGHLADTDRAQDKPVLFMCSRIARTDLVDTLSSAAISVEKVVAYDTVASADASAAVSEAVVKSVEASASSAEVWVAFFSPSGVEAVLPFLLTIPSPVLSRLRYAAIGSTTANALREGKLEAHAVASKPHPDALVSAIQESTTHEKKEHSTVS